MEEGQLYDGALVSGGPVSFADNEDSFMDNDIRDLITQKEKELHDINQVRFSSAVVCTAIPYSKYNICP